MTKYSTVYQLQNNRIEAIIRICREAQSGRMPLTETVLKDVLDNAYQLKASMTVEFEDWENFCGDGCCQDGGTTLRVCGEKITDRYYDDPNVITSVLKAAGFAVEEAN